MYVSHFSTNATGSGSTHIDEGLKTTAGMISSNVGDSCTWYAAGKCSRPRTCYDCLNVKINSTVCAIMPNGMCMSLDNNLPILKREDKLYLSSKSTYCKVDDAACTACTTEWLADYSRSGTIQTSADCTGLDGCICLARCENPNWKTSILTDQCPHGKLQSTGRTPPQIGFALIVGIALGILLGIWALKLLVRCRERRWSRERSAPRTSHTHEPQTRPLLTLTGWKAFRQKWIEIEALKGANVAVLELQEQNSTPVDADIGRECISSYGIDSVAIL
ncbi:uncharacterized protein PHALS_09101 [Plasmopara halstedii]|uniref:Uncharacterized protein n=1 Tax=Plasmopara halstedii TaxID=4781 RepID=A0A0P1AET0_PLAHL|nr:uncharacterized protein PHALS_09101 [Plasmopara halstedii]CEG39036.1 hypothetical protein PHALS_09101 [Plasmopara halstedii]|eukprot:XP_024575405.1 hypothetical protein PHALS_09101 [Plasmopara halstedii]